MKKKFACVGVLTSSGLQRSVHAQPLTPVHRDIQRNFNKKTKQNKTKKQFAFPPITHRRCKIHYHQQRHYQRRRGKSGASRYVSIHGGTSSLQKQKVEVGEASCTWRVLLTGYCGGHTVSRMAVYK